MDDRNEYIHTVIMERDGPVPAYDSEESPRRLIAEVEQRVIDECESYIIYNNALNATLRETKPTQSLWILDYLRIPAADRVRALIAAWKFYKDCRGKSTEELLKEI